MSFTIRRTSLSLLSVFVLLSFSQAQNSYAPEFTSFEPTNTQDMVNLATGDFTYVLPLLEVPGPSGGYPISLHYHAGIPMDQEASWTGLGWNLNVGSINRQINGFPDDWKNAENDNFIWNAGETTHSWSLDVMTGISNTASIGLGLQWSSYRGVGGHLSFSKGVGALSVRGSLGTSGTSIGAGVGNLGVSVGHDYVTGLRGNASVSLSGGGMLGGGYARSSLGLAVNGSGATPYYSTVFGAHALSTLSGTTGADSWTFSSERGEIPVITNLLNVQFNWAKRQYVQYAPDRTRAFGTLYSKEAYRQEDHSSAYAGMQDFHRSMDIYTHTHDIQTHDNKQDYNRNRFTYMAYDNYLVTAEGVGGSFQPFLYENGNLVGRREELEYGTDQGSPFLKNEHRYYFNNDQISKNPEDIYFAFLKTFDSRHRIIPQDIVHTGGPDYGVWDYDAVGNNNEITAPNHHTTRNRKNSARAIEYFTFEDLQQSLNDAYDRGFLETADASAIYPGLPPEGIRAFTVRAEDGRRYHFSLPVYAHYKLNVTEQQTGSNPTTYIEQTTEPYAVQWLLTAITGPDYVDVNNNHQADVGDQGYFVAFRYGKWNEGYMWQNPYHSEEIIEDAAIRRFGIRESYYLDAIQTATHTALFAKTARLDAKASTNGGNPFSFQNKRVIRSGRITWDILSTEYTLQPGSQGPTGQYPDNFWFTIDMWKDIHVTNTGKATLLKLESVTLCRNEDIPTIETIRSLGGGLGVATTTTSIHAQNSLKVLNQTSPNWDFYKISKNNNYSNNRSAEVIDVSDINALASLQEDQKITLAYNYALCGNTPNSDAVLSADGSKAGGKLTLESVEFAGRNALKMGPPYEFTYYDLGNYNRDHMDNWGFYNTTSPLDYNAKPEVHNWSLRSILFPQGNQLEVLYESDEYAYEAARAHLPQVYRKEEELLSGPGIGQQGSSWRERYIPYPSNPSTHYGGGIRVKTLRFQSSSQTYAHEYTYQNGVTSFSPGTYQKQDNYTLLPGTQPNTWHNLGYITYPPAPLAEQTSLPHFVPYQSDLPAPQVIYSEVSVTEKGSDQRILTKTVYAFENLPRALNFQNTQHGFSLGDMFQLTTEQLEPDIDDNGDLDNYESKFLKRQTLRDGSANIGRLKSIRIYNAQNELVRSKQLEYWDLNRDNAYGVSQETFHTISRHIEYWAGGNHWNSAYHMTSSSKILYPTPVIKRVVTFENGRSNALEHVVHDPNTGVLLESRYTNSFGKRYKAVIEPAYTQYPSMGSYLSNFANKHMLVQNTGEKLYSDATGFNDWKLVSASTTQWSDSWSLRSFQTGTGTFQWQPSTSSIWRKQASYQWNSLLNDNEDGTITDLASSSEKFVDFDHTTPSNNNPDHWVQASQTTRFDAFSRPLEVEDPNGIKSGMKYDFKNRILLESNLGAFEELYYSGAEDMDANGYLESELSQGTGTIHVQEAHTGTQSVRLLSQEETFVINGSVGSGASDVFRNGGYITRVWVKASNPNDIALYCRPDNSAEITSTGYVLRAGEWYLLELQVDLSTLSTAPNSVEFGVRNTGASDGFADDFRLHPNGASMVSYVYDAEGYVTHTLDANNIGTRYEYTPAGELVRIYREIEDSSPGNGGFKLRQEHRKLYGRTY